VLVRLGGGAGEEPSGLSAAFGSVSFGFVPKFDAMLDVHQARSWLPAIVA
jgi:hypothetical protein